MNRIEILTKPEPEKPESKSKFYLFKQNNSGGYFERDKQVTEYVIIEAYAAYQANDIARHKGIYFNGYDSGQDCNCCGDRWHEVDDYEGKDKPEIYGEPVETFSDRHGLVTKSEFADVYIYFLDGTMKGVWLNADK